MTADEALAHADLDQYSADPVVGSLAEEVERLRTERARLEKMLNVCSSVHGHNVTLHAERAELRAELERLRILLSNEQDAAKENVDRLRSELHEAQQCRQREHDLRVQFAGELESLRAENAELRKQLVFDGKALADAALCLDELDWFRRREPWVRKHVDHCWFENGEAVQDWEEANPKPGAGT